MGAQRAGRRNMSMKPPVIAKPQSIRAKPKAKEQSPISKARSERMVVNRLLSETFSDLSPDDLMSKDERSHREP